MQDEKMTITLKSPSGAATPQSAPAPVRPKQKGRKILIAGIALLVAVIVAVACLTLYDKFKPVPTTAQTPAAAATATPSGSDPAAIVAAVGKLMLLPDETPTVAVVSDLSKLAGQKFFDNAKEGDVVLMYPQAQKAILYSPTQNKVIEVAPIVNNQPQQ